MGLKILNIYNYNLQVLNSHMLKEVLRGLILLLRLLILQTGIRL